MNWLPIHIGIDIAVFPNPVSDILQIKFEREIDKDVTLYVSDLCGRVVMRQTIEAGNLQETIDVRHVLRGFYTYRILQNSHCTLGKLQLE